MTGSEPKDAVPRPLLVHQLSPRQLQAIDIGIAALLVVSYAHNVIARGDRDRAPEIFALALAAALGIAVRRRAPMSALFLVTSSVAVATAIGQNWVPDPFIAIPMFQVAAVHDRRRSFTALALAGAVLLVGSGIAVLLYRTGGAATFGFIVAVAAWFVGDSVRVRRTYVAGLAEQTAQRQREEIERAQRSVAEERLQIARELHDVVAHSLSVIAVQSGVGRHVIDEQPAEAKKALEAVEATSRSALDELRRMLGILRSEQNLPAALAPIPGVSGLDQLVDQIRAAGFAVDLDISSTITGELSPTVDLSIYRIVQEALTNVVKHAGPASVRVEVRDEPGALVVEVNDDGCGIEKIPQFPLERRSSEVHHGIVGMRERVALFNGSFFAGSRPEGGFRVLVRLPSEELTPR